MILEFALILQLSVAPLALGQVGGEEATWHYSSCVDMASVAYDFDGSHLNVLTPKTCQDICYLYHFAAVSSSQCWCLDWLGREANFVPDNYCLRPGDDYGILYEYSSSPGGQIPVHDAEPDSSSTIQAPEMVIETVTVTTVVSSVVTGLPNPAGPTTWPGSYSELDVSDGHSTGGPISSHLVPVPTTSVGGNVDDDDYSTALSWSQPVAMDPVSSPAASACGVEVEASSAAYWPTPAEQSEETCDAEDSSEGPDDSDELACEEEAETVPSLTTSVSTVAYSTGTPTREKSGSTSDAEEPMETESELPVLVSGASELGASMCAALVALAASMAMVG